MVESSFTSCFPSTTASMINLLMRMACGLFRTFTLHHYVVAKAKKMRDITLNQRRKCKFFLIFALFGVLNLVLCAIGAKWIIGSPWDYEYPYSVIVPCGSIREASDRGLLVSAVTWNPRAVKIEGVTLQIGESWIEREVRREDFMIWFRRSSGTGKFHLCFRLERGLELFDEKWPTPEFVLKNDLITTYSQYFNSIEGSDEILFYITINSNRVLQDSIIACLPNPIRCGQDAPPLAQFLVTSEEKKEKGDRLH